MQTGNEKQCNNECKSGWCCHWEFFADSKSRYNKESVALCNMKGMRIFKHPRSDFKVIVAMPVKCRAHTPKGCSLGDKRPHMCKVFPTSSYFDWPMSKHCVYFDEDHHWAFEDMEHYEPEE